MEFCKFSSEYIISNQTTVDNFFINEFLPYAPENCVKIYIYGLYKCSSPNSYDNTMESFCQVLGLTPQDIEDAFLYWQEQGLVQVLYTTPLQVRFMPPRNATGSLKKFKKSKYADFNAQAQLILEGRMLTSNEYAEYYTFLEAFHFEPTALIMIMQYCTEFKGKNVGYAYILTVARNWAREGITTVKQVEERLNMLTEKSSSVSHLLTACGIKRNATVEEKELYIKWNEEWEFPLDVIEYVVKKIITKSNHPNFNKINAVLASYYELKKFTITEIMEYETAKTELYETAKQVNKTIGVYYENLTTIVEMYISKWVDLGHTKESLVMLATYCFKTGIRTLDGLDKIILKLYKLGIVSENAIEEYVINLMGENNAIKSILEKLGLSRNVTAKDREYYKTWKSNWFSSDELIDFATGKAAGKSNAMQYMNKLLSTWATKGINTKADAEKFKGDFVDNSTKQKKDNNEDIMSRNYSKEDLTALFDNIEEINV